MTLRVVENWKRVQPRLEGFSARRWFYPIALLLIGLITYAYQIAALGFYWDDWEVVFLLNAKSPALLYGYFAFDRPFAWPYQVMYALFGLSPIAWHLATLLLRWGVLLRDLLARETVAPPWRDLLPVLRRMEVRGEIRGGRFVSGFTGEQFSRPGALDLLRAIRREESRDLETSVSNADPLNLTGIILPGPRVSRIAVS